MNISTMKKSALILTIVLVCMPILGTFLSSLEASAEASQYSLIQVIVMGFFNLPFVIASAVGLIVGNTMSYDRHPVAPKVWLIVSIVSSVIGSGIMAAWGLGFMS